MIEKLSNKIYHFLSRKQDITDEKKEIILFGIVRVVEDIPKFVGIVLVGLLLNILKEMLIVSIVTILYKTFVGGVHAKTNLVCFITSLSLVLLTIYTAKILFYYNINIYYIAIMIYLFSVYTIIVYVPADVIEIPKVNLKLRRTLKIKSLIMLNLITIISLFVIKDIYISYIIASSVLYIGLMTTRTLYKLFKTNYGFETYIKEIA